MVTTLGERIKSRLTSLNYRQADLVRACGVSRPTVSDWVNGHVAELKGAHLIAAAKFLQCNASWLSTGIGSNGFEQSSNFVNEPIAKYSTDTEESDPLECELLNIFQPLAESDKKEILYWVRGFVAGRKSNHAPGSDSHNIPNRKKSA